MIWTILWDTSYYTWILYFMLSVNGFLTLQCIGAVDSLRRRIETVEATLLQRIGSLEIKVNEKILTNKGNDELTLTNKPGEKPYFKIMGGMRGNSPFSF